MEKTILLIGNHPPPFGGVPTHIKYLAPYLVSRGWKVHVLAFTGVAKWGFLHTVRMDGYSIHRPAKFLLWLNLIPALARLPFLLKRLGSVGSRHPKLLLWLMGSSTFVRSLILRERVTVISAYHVTAGLFGTLAGEELGIPVVTTVFGELFAESAHYRGIQSQVDYVKSRSARVLSCSRHCADSFRAIGMPFKGEAVHYGIDTSVFHPGNDGTGIRQSHGIGADDVVVGYVARMEREMGLHIFLASIPLVLAQRPDIRFLIVGKSAGLTAEANSCAARHPTSVFVRADASFSDLPLCYAASTMVAVPSINERACLGLAIVEAAATAKPVIVSDVGGGPEVVNKDIGVLVPPGDPEALARAILELAAQPARMHEMGRIGREKMVREFDKDVTNRKMEEIFLEMMSGMPARTSRGVAAAGFRGF